MSRQAGVVFIVASAVCYGAMPILARVAYTSGVSPITLLFLRFAFASPVMLALVAARGSTLPRGKALLALVGLGGLVYVAQALCYFTALTRAPASLVALILYLYPVIVAVGASLIYRERFTLTKGIALGLAVAGAALMIGFVMGGTPAGVALAVAAAVIYAIYILAGTRVMRNVESLPAAAVVICSTAVVYAGMAFIQDRSGRQPARGGWPLQRCPSCRRWPPSPCSLPAFRGSAPPAHPRFRPSSPRLPLRWPPWSSGSRSLP